MADATTNGARTFDRKIEFIENHLPALEVGRYDITVELSISVGGQALAGSPFSSGSRGFVVAGSRFSLKPDDVVYNVFPPEGSLGDHSNVLPHVVLKRSTLPWERPSGAARGVPWLALLLFDDDERPEPRVVTLGELKDVSASSAKFPGFTPEEGQADDDKVTVIDVKVSTLRSIVPAAGDLALLAHVREGTDESGRPSGDELAVVIGNRLPAKGRASTVHLVSFEQRYQGDAFDYQGAGPDDLVRLVSLKSWSFACLDGEQSFKGLLTRVDHDPGTLRLPANGNVAAEKYYARGFAPAAHSMRGGEQTVSFYHGPLAPGAHTSDVRLPARAGDELLRFDPAVGMFDVSYAAAWELGRLLALQSKQFSVGLYNWKRADAQRARQAEQLLLHPHLPSAARPGDSGEMPAAVTAWLRDLSLLKGVPFNYLVPDERMLPGESIRFFRLDSLWVESLLDGAYGVGRVTTWDREQDRSVDVAAAAGARDEVTGFLLRSDAVSGWPGLLVGAADAAGRGLESLRCDRLSPNVLLCLFAGELAAVSLHLKPEDLHFGADTPDQDYPELHKKLRDNRGDETATVVPSLPWRRQPARTLDVSALAALMKAATKAESFTSAQFALEMVEGVDMVVFKRRA